MPGGVLMALTAAERQAAYRARKKAAGVALYEPTPEARAKAAANMKAWRARKRAQGLKAKTIWVAA